MAAKPRDVFFFVEIRGLCIFWGAFWRNRPNLGPHTGILGWFLDVVYTVRAPTSPLLYVGMAKYLCKIRGAGEPYGVAVHVI